MADIDRYRTEDDRGAHALYRRVYGDDAAAAWRFRWDWQYGRNPRNPADGPLIWVAREGAALTGLHGTIPVRLSLGGREIDGAWSADTVVAPERRRQGLEEQLFRAWGRNVKATLGLGLSESSQRLIRKLGWPEAGTVPRLAKPLTRRALRRATWPISLNRLMAAVVTEPVAKVVGRPRPLRVDIEPLDRFEGDVTRLWDRVGGRFGLAVRRDREYLNWRFVEPPHVRYRIAAIHRASGTDGYIVFRHLREPQGRATVVVDFLADPDDAVGLKTLLRWVEAEARAADSDVMRLHATYKPYRRIARQSGFFSTRSRLRVTVKVNARIDAPAAEGLARVDDWHLTASDADCDWRVDA